MSGTSEWAALRTLSRITAIAASQLADLLAGLQVHTHVMRRRAEEAGSHLLSEQESIRKLVDPTMPADLDPTSYLGASDQYLDAAVQRAQTWLESRR